MPIRIIAFEVDNTVWSGSLNKTKFGKGPGAAPKVEDNLEIHDSQTIRDRSEHANYVKLFSDIPRIVQDVAMRGIKLAVVSRNPSKALCNRALHYYTAEDKQRTKKSLNSFLAYSEIGIDDLSQSFSKIRGWSQAAYDEMIFFDSNPLSKEGLEKLGIHFELVSKRSGVTWDIYQRALERASQGKPAQDPKALRTIVQSKRASPTHTQGSQPALGKLLGEGKYAKTYDSADNPLVAIKVMKDWTSNHRHRFLDIYAIIKDGRSFKPGNNKDDLNLLMVALELRNLHAVGKLKDPVPGAFSGWLSMTKAAGTPLWKLPLYHEHPFSVTFQLLLKAAFYLAVNEIEDRVKKSGIEHCDAHLGNVLFIMRDDQPVKADLIDWGIAGRMSFDGSQYLRHEDNPVFHEMTAGQKFTPKEFRRYWISWMVKTEYEAKMRRGVITEKDGGEFLKNLKWWFT